MSNNNVSDGPIPFFSGGDNQSSFLSETNITNNTTTQNQPVQQNQSTQQQNTTTSKSSNQPLLDVSSIFGDSKEDSFLSSINNQGTELNNTNTNTNSQIPSTLPTTNSLYYNQTNNGSTVSLNQSYNSYIPNSNSNPQSVNSSNTNLSSFNQINNTNTTGNTNSKVIPNKSPYMSSPEPNATSYNTTGTTTNNYAQGFYINQATQNSSTNLSSNTKNYPTNESTSSLNSFQAQNQTQTYPHSNYSNYQNSYSTYNTNNNVNSYLSPSSTTNSGATTPVMAKSALNTTSYGTNTVSSAGYSNSTSQNSTTTTTGYANTTTGAQPTTGYTNTANGTTTIGYTNTQTGTSTSVNNYMNTQSSTTTPAATSTTGYSNVQTNTVNNTTTTYQNNQSNTATVTNPYSTQVSSTNYSTTVPANTSTYPATSNYQTPQTNTTTGGYSTQANTTNSTYGGYPQTTNSSKNNNLLNPSASYSSLNTLTSTYNTTTTAATKPTDTTSTQNIGQKTGNTNFGNDSSSQLNYYNNTNTTGTTNGVNAPSIRSNTPGANSINELPATTATGTNGANTSTFSSSLYYQNKNSQKFYSNPTTSNSSPCLNSMSMSYPGNNENNVKKNTYDTSGKHVKANSVLSPSSTYQNSLYNANINNNVDNTSYNGSINSKNEVPASGSSLYYHEDNNGKFRSPTAPPSSDNNASKLSPSPTNPNLNRPPSVPPNYGSYNYGTNTSTATTTVTTTTSWNNSTTPSMNYSSSSYTTPANSTYTSTTYPVSTTPTLYQPDTTANSTYRPTSTTPNPYQSDAASGVYRPTSTTPNPYQSDAASGVYRPSSTTPNPYQSDAGSGVYRPTSTTPNPYQPSTTPNPYQSDAGSGVYRPTSTTPNPYQPSTTPNPYQSDISNNQNNFYNFDNQSQSEMHSYDPIVMHQNLSPIVTFGFGGKLVVMFPKDLSGYGGNTIGPNSVHIKPISSLIYPHVIETNKEHEGPILGQKKNKKQIVEMITKKINKIQNKNNQYSNYSSVSIPDSDEVLILKIIQLYIENDGVLYGQNSKPEAVQSLRNLLLNNEPAPLNVTHSMINGPSINSSEIENIKNCLLQGDRPGACKIAVNNKLWAHALIIASYINKETYKDVVNSFIKSELQGENDSQRSSFQSIKVLYSLFAGMGKDAIGTVAPSAMTNSISAVPTIQSSTTSSVTNISDIVGRWKEILGMILSNRTPNDITAIVSLGDTLLSSGKLFAAHLCYLFSPSSISGLGNKSTKAVILGADHLKNKKFYQDLSAFEMTEFLEYMYYLANKNLSTMPHFQAYKLAYASWLSEIGLVTKAFSYAQCIMQIVKSGTSNNSNGTTSSSLYYNSTFFESLKEFSSRCQGNLSGTKNAPKDGWFSKITKFDTFLEAFDHGLNKFIGTTENENVPNLNNTTSVSSSTKPQVPNPVAMMPASTISNVPTNSNVGITNSTSYQGLSQTYYNSSYSTDNLSNLGSRKNSFSKGEQKGVFSLIGNLFNKNGGSTSNNSSTTSLNQDESNKNGYYDSMTKQWVTTNPQNNDNFGKDISAPPPVASDSYYNSGYNSNNNGMINNNSTTAGTLSNGVIPQFGAMGTTNGVNNSRRNNRNKYNDPTLSMAYSNTNTQANATSTLYSNNTTVNQNNTTYNNTYNWNNYGK